MTAAIRAANTRAELATKSTAGKAKPKAGAQGRTLTPHEISNLVRKAMVAIASEYGEGVLRGCLMTLGKDEVKSYQLTAG